MAVAGDVIYAVLLAPGMDQHFVLVGDEKVALLISAYTPPHRHLYGLRILAASGKHLGNQCRAGRAA